MAATAADRSLEIVREWSDVVFNGRDYDRQPEFQAADYVQHGPLTGMELQGNEEALETTKLFHAAFSDLESTEEFAFSDGEYVCSRQTYRGTHDGDFMGIPPTDKHAEVSGIVINRIENDKIAEAWVVVDFLSLFQQLDLVPSIEEIAG